MLFKRRTPAPMLERVRVALWPRRNWGRSVKYVLHRVWRLKGSPHSIAIGCAAGVFISFTPFLGFHFILAGIIAWIVGGNILASALGTFFGNPLTFPFIWLSTFKTGHWLLGGNAKMSMSDLETQLVSLTKGLFSTSIDGIMQAVMSFWPIMKPMAVGAVPLGFCASVVSFYIIRKAVESYQHRKQEQLVSAAVREDTGPAEA